MARLSALREALQFYKQAKKNLAGWKKLITTPPLREEYGRYVVKPAVSKVKSYIPFTSEWQARPSNLAIRRFQEMPQVQKAGLKVGQWGLRHPTTAQFIEGFLTPPKNILALGGGDVIPKRFLTLESPKTTREKIAYGAGRVIGEAPYWIGGGKVIEAPLAAKLPQTMLKSRQLAQAAKLGVSAGAATPFISPFLSEGTLEERFAPKRLAGETATDVAFTALLMGSVKPVKGVLKAADIKAPKAVDQKYSFNINLKKLGLNKQEREVLHSAVEKIKPTLQKVKGKPLSHQEIVKMAAKSEILQGIIPRSQTKEFSGALYKTRSLIAELDKELAQTNKLSPGKMRTLLEAIQTQSSLAADWGRTGHAFMEEAGKGSLRTTVLEEVSRIEKNTNKILKEADKVDWKKADSITKFYRKFVKPSFAEVLKDYRYSNLLLNPRTHLRNLYSNVIQAFATRPLTKAFSGDLAGVAKYYGGILTGLPKATQNFKDSLRGYSPIEKPDIAYLPSGKLPRFYSIGPRLMEAGDQFFRSLIVEGELASGKTLKEAEQVAQYSLFRSGFDPKNKTGQGYLLSFIDNFNQKISALRKDVKIGNKTFPNPVGWAVPFLQTPMNVAKQYLEYSPAGLLTIPGAKRKKEQLAKSVIGSVALSAIASLASEGKMTWTPPAGEEERKVFYASGRKPFSVRIGDKWVPFFYFGPFAPMLAVVAATQHYYQQSKSSLTDDQLTKLKNIAADLVKYISEQTPLTGLNGLFKVLSGDIDYTSGGWAGFTAEQFIPWSSLVSYVTKVLDPVYRQAKGFKESIQRDLPLVSSFLKAHETPLGEPSKRNLSDYLLPYTVGRSKESYEKQVKQLEEISKIGYASRKKTADLKEEAERLYKEWSQLPGKEANQRARELKLENPQLYNQLKNVVEEHRLGLNEVERKVKALPVGDGTRARYVASELKKLKTNQEKNALVKDWRKKKIISDTVFKQLKEMKKRGQL